MSLRIYIKSGLSIAFVFGMIALPFLVTAATAAQKQRVAILNFRANNTAKAYADVVRDILEVHLYKTNTFDIIERNQIDVILKEQGLEDKYCSDAGCAVRIGKILSVDKVVIGSVNRVGKFTITIKFVDVREGLVEYADSEIAQIEGVIETAVDTLAKRSSERLAAGKIKQREYTNSPRLSEYYFRGFMPGWAQFYSGNTLKGFLYIGGFVLAGSFSIWAYLNYDNKRSEYRNANLGTSRAKFDKKFENYKRATSLGRISLAVFALSYVANWIDVLFFSRPEIEEQTERNFSLLNFENRDVLLYIYNRGNVINDTGLQFGVKAKF